MANLSRVGADCKLYYDKTEANPANRLYVLVTNAIDVEMSISSNTATFASRTGSWEAQAPTLKTAEISFGYEYTLFDGIKGSGGTDDPVFTDIMASLTAGTVYRWVVADNVIDSTGVTWQGLEMYGHVTEFSESQPLQDGVTFSCTIAPARFVYSGTVYDPTWQQELGIAANTTSA